MSSFDMPSAAEACQIEAVVKWFNLSKGFGFVAPADGSADAFIHSSVVSRAGLRELAEGARLLVEIGVGLKGRQVVAIIQILGMSDGATQSSGRAPATGPETEMTGTVKWYKLDKGFGFVAPDDGGRDIFVHRSVVLQAGAQSLESGQRLKMVVQTAAKGREATAIQIAG